MASKWNIPERGAELPGCSAVRPVECCLHGQKCSVALRTMSTETLTRIEMSDKDASRKREVPRFKLQREESFSKFKFTQLLGQEYICERDVVQETASEGEISKVMENSAFPLKRYYIGIVTPQTAELFVSRNTAFRVYHSLKDVKEASLQLFIVYKSSRSDFYHYPIRERFDEKLHTSLLHVEYGDDECPEFIGIEALIKFYTIYASLHSFSSSCGLAADVFPWWHLTDKPS